MNSIKYGLLVSMAALAFALAMGIDLIPDKAKNLKSPEPQGRAAKADLRLLAEAQCGWPASPGGDCYRKILQNESAEK